jgi:Domain of unknown function (DUF1905)
MRFQATLELGGRTATGIEVPSEVVTGLGSHKRPPVMVTINGFSYRSTIATMGGRFLIPVSAEVRKHAGVEAGDELDVLSVEGAKATETRARRIVKIVDTLR